MFFVYKQMIYLVLRKNLLTVSTEERIKYEFTTRI